MTTKYFFLEAILDTSFLFYWPTQVIWSQKAEKYNTTLCLEKELGYSCTAFMTGLGHH